MTDYAVHTQEGDTWSLDSIFDDPELAIYEAHCLKERATFEDVRVVSLRKTEKGDDVDETIYIASSETDETDGIVKHVEELRDKSSMLPPGLIAADSDEGSE